MSEVKNCLLPDDLYYSVENSLWVRDLEDGTGEVGMTDIAQTLAGAMLHCTAKKVGKTVKKRQEYRHRGIGEMGGSSEISIYRRDRGRERGSGQRSTAVE